MAKAQAKKTEPKQPEIKPIDRQSISRLEHAHTTHVVEIDQALTPEQLEDPQLWAVIAAGTLRRFDRLQIQTRNGSQLSFGVVRQVQGTQARVSIYDHYQFEEIVEEEVRMNGYIIRFGGLRAQWEIVEASTGTTLRDEFMTQGVAIKYLQDHFKALGVPLDK